MSSEPMLRVTPDVEYAVFLSGNSENFRPDLAGAERFGREIFFHRVAISIELALKAYLTHAGIDDDWQRRCIGHDLAHAFDLAESLGMVGPPAAGDIIRLVHPYFMQGGFHGQGRDWPEAMMPIALGVIDGIVREAKERVGPAAPS